MAITKNKATLLYENKNEEKYGKVEFKVGYDNYCVDISRKTVTIGLLEDDNAVTEKVGDPVSKIYLFERADQKRYLVIFTKYLWYGGYHVYNLNGKRITKSLCSVGDFEISLSDIKDPSNFELMAVSDLIGDTVAKKNFYMDPCGRIKSPDEYAYYIKGSSILDGKPLAKTGDVMTVKTDIEIEASKTPEDPDTMEEITLKKGTKVTFYKTKDRDVYLRIPDGRQIVIHMLDENEDPGDEPITYIEDMFEDIPCFPS